jgi:uncharacterized DUF497 family protein
MADPLSFAWDQSEHRHIGSHHVTPEEVEPVFADDKKDIDYDVIGGEERWTVLRETDLKRAIIVVFTLRNESIRTVTTRPAREQEQNTSRRKGR